MLTKILIYSALVISNAFTWKDQAKSISEEISQPNLTLTNVYYNGSNELQFTIENNGTVAASNVSIRVYYFTCDGWKDVTLNGWSVPANSSVPNTLDEGDLPSLNCLGYGYIAVDPSNNIVESNESDNQVPFF